MLGDNLGFALGHFGGRPLALRYGRYVFLTPERLDKTTEFFARHGGKVIVVARFIEGLRQLNGIIAGMSGMPWGRFVVFNAIGAALWVGVWTAIGYFSGSHIDTIYRLATRYSTYLLVALGVLVVAYLARRLLRAAEITPERGSAPAGARRRRRRPPATIRWQIAHHRPGSDADRSARVHLGANRADRRRFVIGWPLSAVRGAVNRRKARAHTRPVREVRSGGGIDAHNRAGWGEQCSVMEQPRHWWSGWHLTPAGWALGVALVVLVVLAIVDPSRGVYFALTFVVVAWAWGR